MRASVKTIMCVAAVLLTACDAKQAGNTPVAAAVGSKAAAPAAVAANSAPPAATGAGLLNGKVLETFDGGGYTYVRVASGGGEAWAAVRETKVAVGDTISIAAQMTMENFRSNTLDRTFDRIVFGEIAGEGAAPAMQMPAGHPSGGMKMPPSMASGMTPSQHMQAPDAGDVKVEKAAGGMTVAEIWGAKESLRDKDVVVRGKVVKFLGGIMGTNWMHLRDGSGSSDKGDHDITITTDETAAVGDVVTVKGRLAVDKDFGAGYRYAAIIEKAKLTK